MPVKKKNTASGPRYYVETRSGGRKVYHPGGHATRRSADAALSRLKVAKDDGTYRAPQSQTVAAFLDSWLTSHKGVRPRTKARYAQAIRDHITPVIGDVKVQALRVEDCQRVVDAAEAAGLEPGSVVKIASILRAALSLSVKRGNLVRESGHDGTRPPAPGRAEAEAHPPTPQRSGASSMLRRTPTASHSPSLLGQASVAARS